MAVASADRSVTGFQQADVSDVVDDEAVSSRPHASMETSNVSSQPYDPGRIRRL